MISGVLWLVMCLWLAWMWLIVVVCLLLLPPPTFAVLPCGEEPHRENETKPRRKMDWFFFTFFAAAAAASFFLSSVHHSWWLFQASPLFTHHPLLSTRRPSLELSSSRTIRSLSASLFLFYEVSKGRGYSSLRIKWEKWKEWLSMFSCLSPPQSHAPVDLYLMTKNPQDAPNTPDVLEIEFKNGAWMLLTNVRTQHIQAKYHNKNNWPWKHLDLEIPFKHGYKVLRKSWEGFSGASI